MAITSILIMRNRYSKVINVILLGLLLEFTPFFSPRDFDTNEEVSNLTLPSSAEDSHDLSIILSISNRVFITDNISYFIQIENKGNVSETAFYSIWVNNSKILEDSVWADLSYQIATLEYLNFSAPGLYNITAIVSSASGEDENWEDNTYTEWMEVVSETVIKYTPGDFMSHSYSEYFTGDEPSQQNITYQDKIDDCHVRVEMTANGNTSSYILNTFTRVYEDEDDNQFFMFPNMFYWQIGTNVSIGCEIPFSIFPMTIVNETNFQFKGMGLNAWIAEFFDTFYYYHKETGVLLGIANSTKDLIAELTETNIIEIQIPHLITPSDINMEYGVSSTDISWSAEDSNPAYYNLLCNGLLIVNSTWNNSENITFDMGDYLPGIYVLNLVVYNTLGQFISENITVRIVDTTTPVISGPNDVFISEGTTEYELSWNVTDSLPNSYYILKDGVIIFDSTWVEGEISFILENLTVGEYMYELRVNDTSGNIATDSVMVTVSKKSIGLPGNLATFLIFIEIIATVQILIKKYNKHSANRIIIPMGEC